MTGSCVLHDDPRGKGRRTAEYGCTADVPRTLPPPLQACLAKYSAAWAQQYPHCLGTRGQVAAHEMGHGVVSVAVGFGFQYAEIHQLDAHLNSRASWSGTFAPKTRLNDITSPPIEAVLAESSILLGGLVGGSLIADADPMNHSMELMNAAYMAYHCAKASGYSFDFTFRQFCSYTARIVAFHRSDLQTLANRLERKGRVAHDDRKVARLLQRIGRTPGRAVPPAPEQERSFIRHLDRVPIALHDFARETYSLNREVRR